MPDIFDPERHALFWASTGGGKTTLALRLASRAPPPWQVVFVNYQRFHSPMPAPWVTARTAEAAYNMVIQGQARIEYVPEMGSQGDQNIALLANALMFRGRFREEKRLPRQQVLVIMDEVEAYLDEKVDSDTPVVNVAKRGRALGVKGWFIVQRPSRIREILGNCQHFFLGREAPQDVVTLRQNGVDLPPKVLEYLAPDSHNFLLYDWSQFYTVVSEEVSGI